MLSTFPDAGSNIPGLKEVSLKMGFNGNSDPSHLEGVGLLSAVQKGASHDMWVLILKDNPNGSFVGSRLTMSCAAGPVDLKAQTVSFNPRAQTNTMGAVNVTVANVAKTYTRASGSFLTDGFALGQTVTWAGFADSDSNGDKTIVALSATVMTVAETVGADEGPVADTTCTGIQEANRLVVRFSKASDNTVVAPPAADANSWLLIEMLFRCCTVM